MRSKKDHNLRHLAAASLLAALTCLATLIVITYSPTGGYVHLGDCFVLIAGFVLGPLWGGVAAGLGAALTDFILGYAQYVPATFLIKWAVAAVVAALFRLLSKPLKSHIVRYATAAVVGECIMVAGYFLYELMLYGIGGAVAGIVPNFVQAASGVVAATLLMIPISRISYIKRFFD